MVNKCPSKRSGVRASLFRALATNTNMGLESTFSSGQVIRNGEGTGKKPPLRLKTALQKVSD